MIFLLLFALPALAVLVAEYAVCRFPKRRFWRGLPPLLTAAGTAVVALHRYHGWSSGADKAPWEQLLFIPGLPALGALFGAYLGWRLWKRLWLPRGGKDRPGGT